MIEIRELFKANKKAKEIWKEVLKEYEKGALDYKTIPVIGETPFIYYGANLGLDKGIIKISQKNLKHIKEKHPQVWLNIENIIDYIADPLAVFGSLNVGQEKSLVVLTDKFIKSRDGDETKKELLTIILTPQGKNRKLDIGYTILVSVYGFNEFDIKKYLKGKVNDSGEFVNTLKYFDEEKTLKVADLSELQGANSLMQGWNNFKSNYIIVTKNEIVNDFLNQQIIVEDTKDKYPTTKTPDCHKKIKIFSRKDDNGNDNGKRRIIRF